MKKNKYLIILIIITSIVCSLSMVCAYFTTSVENVSLFSTKEYLFEINAQGGKYDNTNVMIVGNTTILPVPTKVGYSFSGYNDEQNINYSININNVDDINNKKLYANWSINTYSIFYNLNGGTINGQKTSYTVEDENFTLPVPSKNGYSFIGWTGSNGSTNQTSVTISKGTINNLSYTANWSVNSYRVDVNPIINGTAYDSGKSGYTFDIWVNGVLVGDNVIDWCQNVNYGSTVRVKTNNVTGSSTNFDKTITVGTSSVNINPAWNINSYQVDVNPIIDGNAYNSGKSGYTFSVWVNDSKVATNVIDWCQTLVYGTKVRIVANGVSGYNITANGDKTITVGTSNVNINPTWLDNIGPTITGYSISGVTYYGHNSTYNYNSYNYWVNASASDVNGVSKICYAFWSTSSNKWLDPVCYNGGSSSEDYHNVIEGRRTTRLIVYDGRGNITSFDFSYNIP